MNNSKKGCCLKSWDSICAHKNVRGLGIKKIVDMNKALVAKMNWDVVNNSNESDGFQEEICSEQKLHKNAHSKGCFLGISKYL